MKALCTHFTQGAEPTLANRNILDPLPYLCSDSRCFGSNDGKPLYFDYNHLTEDGNKLLTAMFMQVFRAR